MGRWSLTAAVVNGVIGSGIFGLPSTLAGLAGTWSPLLVLFAGACIFIVILCFAEVSGRFDEPGGPYLYAREAFGPAVGFHVGWLLLFTRLLSAAAAMNILVAYLATLLPIVGTPGGRAAAMVVAVGTVTAVNLAGVRSAAWTTNVFTVAKVLPLLLLAGLGLFAIAPEVQATQEVASPAFLDALLLLVFAYGGFESIGAGAGESRNPRRDMGFGLVTATIIITVIYALVQFVVTGVLPNAASTTTPIAAALAQLIGPAGITVVSLGVVVSIYGWLTGFTLLMPRVLYSMAIRGELPAALGYVHPVTRTPSVAIVANAAIALALSLYSSFAQAAVLAAIVRLLVFLATCVALPVLRRRQAGRSGFHVPGGDALAVAGALFSVWLLSTRSLGQIWILFAVVGSGLAVRRWYTRPDPTTR